MRLSTSFICGFLLFTTGVILGFQEQGNSQRGAVPRLEEVSIDIPDDPQPLARLAEILERKFGTGISYEDAPWVYSGDTIPASEHPANRKFKEVSPNWRGPLVPRGGSLSIRLRVDMDSRKPTETPMQVLQDAVNLHRGKSNPGDFRIISLGEDGFSIVPTGIRDQAGRSATTQSPLDNRISFPEVEMNGEDALQQILRSTSIAAKKQILLAGTPFFPDHKARIGASNEVARDVILRLVHQLRPSNALDTKNPIPRVAWQMNFVPDPAPGFYWFNWHTVLRETSTPGGAGISLAPVVIPRSDTPNGSAK